MIRSRLRTDVLPVAGAFVLLLLLMVACRGATLVSQVLMNPDEAEILAAGRRAALDLSPYVTYTSPTYLALWPMFLGVLDMLGVPMSIAVAHVLSGLAYVWIALAGWIVMARSLGWRLSGAFVLPTTAIVLLSPGPQREDFLSLGTELLPLSMLMLGALVLLSGGRIPGVRRLAVVCVIAGLSVWAKPQAGVLALALCAVGFLLRRLPPVEPGPAEPSPVEPASTEPVPGAPASAEPSSAEAPSAWRDLLIIAAAFAAPTVLLLLLMLVQGTLPRFMSEPVAVIAGYISTRQDVAGGTQPLTIRNRLAAAGSWIEGQPWAFMWAVPGLAFLTMTWGAGYSRARVIGAAIWLVPLAAAALTLTVTQPIFTHYTNFVYAACMLSGMGGLMAARAVRVVRVAPPALVPPGWTPRRALELGVSTVILATMVMGVVLTRLDTSGVATNVSSVVTAATGHAPAAVPAGSPVAAACPPGSRVLVWGWAAELYAAYDWTPASRYVTSWPLATFGEPATYKATMEAELTAQPPDCVVQAIGPQFFGGLGDGDSIAARMPDVADYILMCYTSQEDVVAVGYTSAPALSDTRVATIWRWSGACPRG